MLSRSKRDLKERFCRLIRTTTLQTTLTQPLTFSPSGAKTFGSVLLILIRLSISSRSARRLHRFTQTVLLGRLIDGVRSPAKLISLGFPTSGTLRSCLHLLAT